MGVFSCLKMLLLYQNTKIKDVFFSKYTVFVVLFHIEKRAVTFRMRDASSLA